jgi:hypothetical protein
MMAKNVSDTTPLTPTTSDMKGQLGTDVEGAATDNKAFSQQVLSDIAAFICGEIILVQNDTERSEFLQRVRLWRRQREIIPASATKNTPWVNASNACSPLSAIKTNGVYAKVKGAFTQRKPFWTVETEDKDWQETTRVLATYMNAIAKSRYHMDLMGGLKEALYNQVSLGTEFVALPWVVENVSFGRPDPATGNIVQQELAVRNCVGFVPLKLENVLTRAFWKDIQRAPWISVKYQYYWYELQAKQALGVYMNVDQLQGMRKARYWPDEQAAFDNAGVKPDIAKIDTYEIYETYMRWDLDGSGRQQEIIITVEPLSNTILRAELNPIGIRPIARMPYLDITDTIYAVGIGWLMERLEEEATTVDNMLFNGTALSNLQMLAVRRDSGIGPNETVEAGKIVYLDDPTRDIAPIRFPDVAQSLLYLQKLIADNADRVSGASDYILGYENRNVGTAATASGTMFLAQQNQSVLSAIMEQIETGFREVGRIVMYQLMANKDNVDYSLIDPKDVPLLKKLLAMNPLDVTKKISLSIEMTEVDRTEEAERQLLMTKFQLYAMLHDKMMQDAQVMSNPQVQQVAPKMVELAQQFYAGWATLGTELMETLGDKDPEKMIPFVQDILLQIQLTDAQKEMALQGVKNAIQQRGGIAGLQSAGGGGAAPGMGAPAGQGTPAGAGGAVPPGPLPTGGVPPTGNVPGEMLPPRVRLAQNLPGPGAVG